MGLFGFGKKKDDAAAAAPAADAQATEAAAPAEKTITAQVVGQEDGENLYHCPMCKKDMKESAGNFTLGGSSFCCSECCPPKADGEEGDGTCEFC